MHLVGTGARGLVGGRRVALLPIACRSLLGAGRYRPPTRTPNFTFCIVQNKVPELWGDFGPRLNSFGGQQSPQPGPRARLQADEEGGTTGLSEAGVGAVDGMPMNAHRRRAALGCRAMIHSMRVFGSARRLRYQTARGPKPEATIQLPPPSGSNTTTSSTTRLVPSADSAGVMQQEQPPADDPSQPAAEEGYR